MRLMSRRVLSAGVVVCGLGAGASGDLAVASQFPSGVGNVGMGFDALTDTAWAYGSFAADLRKFTSSGASLGTFVRPGEAANDVDIDVTTVPMTLGTTSLPAGTVLFINGESGVAEVYAMNAGTGAVMATLPTMFGASHVVGGAHHPTRGTIFLVQDRVAGAADENRVAEINPVSGAVIQVWLITATRPTFTINFGDIDVAPNGNILLVSSDEATIGEFTPTGGFVAEHALPTGVTSLCGIGVNDSTCDVWVASTSGTLYRLTGLPECTPACDGIDFNNDGLFPDTLDLDDFISVFGGGACSTGMCGDIDFNNDGLFPDTLDIDSMLSVFSGGACL